VWFNRFCNDTFASSLDISIQEDFFYFLNLKIDTYNRFKFCNIKYWCWVNFAETNIATVVVLLLILILLLPTAANRRLFLISSQNCLTFHVSCSKCFWMKSYMNFASSNFNYFSTTKLIIFGLFLILCFSVCLSLNSSKDLDIFEVHLNY